MKEFGGTPGQWRMQNTKDIKFVTTILSTYNRIKNKEMDKMSKRRVKVGGSGVKHNPLLGKKYMRTEKIGPGGTGVVETPI